jgi:acetolactate synthase regulatory subunit
MTWRFDVVATLQERLLSRILQMLDVQRVSIHSFRGEMNEVGANVTFVISSEDDKAHRIQALLYRLQDVETVSLTRHP